MQRSWWFHFRTPPRDSPSFLAAPNEALGSILFFAMQNRNSYIVLFLGVITHSTPQNWNSMHVPRSRIICFDF